MRYAYAVQEVRRAEAALAAGLSPGTLIARATAGMAARCLRLIRADRGRVPGARVVLLVGSGDNGADALWVGVRLARRGVQVSALLTSDRADGTALAALQAAGGRLGTGLAGLEDADLVLDGIVGIGGTGGLRPGAARAVSRAEASGALLVAIDLPSGVDADTGEVSGAAVHADVTLCAGVLKPGLLVDPAASHAGLLDVVDIGLGPVIGPPALEVLDAGDIAALLPEPPPESDKYSRGVVGVRAGSAAYPGAAVLATGGAVRGGAGMVRYLGPDEAARAVLARWPEVVAGDGRVQARVIGPGIADLDDALRVLVAQPEPVVLDAAATTLHALAGGDAVLTPHAGELAALLTAMGTGVSRADIEGRRLHWARRSAELTGCVVLLKGSTTVLATPDGRTRVNPTGTPWLATAGSGDVLAGLTGAFVARGLDPFDAAAAGAWVHGLAGRLSSSGAPTDAGRVLDAVPEALRRTSD